VTAESHIGGETFKDVNQTARPSSQADPSKPTLIADRAVDKTAAKPGKQYPNGNMKDAHAEVGVIQQAYDSGKL
jgi:filamentous hemagglutinin